MRHDEIEAAKLLRGLGIIGKLLNRGEQPGTRLRQALARAGYRNNEIAMIFDVLRDERLPGLHVNIRRENDTNYWSLDGIIVRI